MRICVALAALSFLCAGNAQAEPKVPLPTGTYRFRHMDAEFPRSPGFPVTVKIQGRRITVVNEHQHGVIPKGVLQVATLMWHAKSKQWILGHEEADQSAAEVGGCSAGPDTIDFSRRIIWTCEGGP